jgi:hypothetical protein
MSLVMLCLLCSAIIVNGQTSPSNPENTKIQNLADSGIITNQSSSGPNPSFQLPETLNGNYKAPTYEPTSDDQQRSITILNNVLDIDLSKYVVILDSEGANDRYFGLPQNRIEYYLTSEQDSMRIACTYIGDKLHQIYISDWTDTNPQTPQTTELEKTKSLLTQYREQTKNPLYDTMRNMLDDVKSNENLTKTQGNLNLDITVIGDASTNFIWTYVDQDGNIAQAKNLVISYNQNRLQCFQDSWDLYQIAGTPKVSEKEAIETALWAIQNYQYNLSTAEGVITVTDFKAEVVTDLVLSYLNEFEPDTRGDAFVLYPSWYVPLGFDKVYRGGITGAVVRVWADNGQVSSINPMIYNIETPETSPTTNTAASTILPLALLAGMLGTTTGCCIYLSVVKKRGLKVWKALPICGLILFSLFAVTAQPATAAVNSKAEIYASYWEQSPGEQSAMSTLTTTIQSRFNSVGYDTQRYCGTETSGTVYANIQNDNLNYIRTAIFHFGHMAGAGNYTCSDTSVVTYSGVNSAASGYTDKHFFTFLWACYTANDANYQPNVNAFAKSWSQRSGMSSNGYNYPDNAGSCYIGFDGASPMLGHAIYNTTTVQGSSFIDNFYWYALTQGGYSVHDSLNQATLSLFGIPFDTTPLATGCFTYFPGINKPPLVQPANDYTCKMMVYGNSNIYLRQYYPYIHYDTVVWGAGAVNNPTYVHGPAPDGAYTQLWGGNYNDGGSVISTMTGSLGNGFSRGNIYLYGYSASGYSSHIYVYGSKTGYNDWQLVTQGYITSATPGWYNIGRPSQDFKYLSIVGINDQGWSCNLMIDAVRVIP